MSGCYTQPCPFLDSRTCRSHIENTGDDKEKKECAACGCDLVEEDEILLGMCANCQGKTSEYKDCKDDNLDFDD